MGDRPRRGDSQPGATEPESSNTPAPKPFKVEAHSFHFRPGIDLDKMNQLVDELEVEEFVRKQHD